MRQRISSLCFKKENAYKVLQTQEGVLDTDNDNVSEMMDIQLFDVLFLNSLFRAHSLEENSEKTKIAWSEERTTEKRNLKRRTYKSSAQQSRDYKSIWYVV